MLNASVVGKILRYMQKKSRKKVVTIFPQLSLRNKRTFGFKTYNTLENVKSISFYPRFLFALKKDTKKWNSYKNDTTTALK